MQDYQELEDERDVTIFVEHYPRYVITTCWRDDGTVAWHNAGHRDDWPVFPKPLKR